MIVNTPFQTQPNQYTQQDATDDVCQQGSQRECNIKILEQNRNQIPADTTDTSACKNEQIIHESGVLIFLRETE